MSGRATEDEGITVGHPGEGEHPHDDAGGRGPDPQHADDQPGNPAKHEEDQVPDSEMTARAPVTKARVEGCYTSAEYWARALPHYADREQRWADICSLFAGLVAAVTGLAIWPLLTGVTGDKVTDVTPGTILFSIGALLAGVAALLPRVFSFGEMAGHARELASQYGAMVGDLRDLRGEATFDPIAARAVVEAFDKTKAKKDALRRLPNRETEETQWAIDRGRRAQAETDAAEAELKAAKAMNALAKERKEGRPAPAEG